SAAARARHGHHRHRGRRGHAEFGLECLHELAQLEHADTLDVVDNLRLRHFGHDVLSLFFNLSRGPTPRPVPTSLTLPRGPTPATRGLPPLPAPPFSLR